MKLGYWLGHTDLKGGGTSPYAWRILELLLSHNDYHDIELSILCSEEIQSDWGQAAYDLRQEAIQNLINAGFSKEEAKRAVPTDYGFKKELTQEEKNLLKVTE